MLDIVSLVNYVLVGEYNNNADINSDSILNVLDIVLLVNIILNPEKKHILKQYLTLN